MHAFICCYVIFLILPGTITKNYEQAYDLSEVFEKCSNKNSPCVCINSVPPYANSSDKRHRISAQRCRNDADCDTIGLPSCTAADNCERLCLCSCHSGADKTIVPCGNYCRDKCPCEEKEKKGFPLYLIGVFAGIAVAMIVTNRLRQKLCPLSCRKSS